MRGEILNCGGPVTWAEDSCTAGAGMTAEHVEQAPGTTEGYQVREHFLPNKSEKHIK